ncbi:MAG: 3'(2'),5'-bisphosphate nucleotidase CysQ [Alicyclobacillus sp.]|nr:3'(2'),5'-bisphosphate nucleotidase CysQ [Alicyclobacillus sp.]
MEWPDAVQLRSGPGHFNNVRKSAVYERELQVAKTAALAAGREILRLSENGFETSYKANEDPLTTADLAANEILRTTLLGTFPDDGWLSEETQDDPARLSRARVWIVDPIDGTKEFVEGVPQYSVSVALAVNGEVVVGVICNPARDELFWAAQGEGAFLNDDPVAAMPAFAGKPAILASRSEVKRGQFDDFMDDFDVTPVGSVAYKLALVSAGSAAGTFSLVPKNEWDIAAGVLLVQEAGGRVVQLDGAPFQFNREDTLVDGIVACSEPAFPVVWSRIRDGRPGR